MGVRSFDAAVIDVRSWVYSTSQPGIETRHVFSSGAHYDPANVSSGPVVGCDRHSVAPGAGFDWHGHRGVVIVSWLLSGELRHEGPSGELLVRPGEVLVQATGSGIRHRETNPSASEPLVFVQLSLLSDADVQILRTSAPTNLPGGGRFVVASEAPTSGTGFALDTGTGAVLVVEFGR